MVPTPGPPPYPQDPPLLEVRLHHEAMLEVWENKAIIERGEHPHTEQREPCQALPGAVPPYFLTPYHYPPGWWNSPPPGLLWFQSKPITPKPSAELLKTPVYPPKKLSRVTTLIKYIGVNANKTRSSPHPLVEPLMSTVVFYTNFDFFPRSSWAFCIVFIDWFVFWLSYSFG